MKLRNSRPGTPRRNLGTGQTACDTVEEDDEKEAESGSGAARGLQVEGWQRLSGGTYVDITETRQVIPQRR